MYCLNQELCSFSTHFRSKTVQNSHSNASLVYSEHLLSLIHYVSINLNLAFSFDVNKSKKSKTGGDKYIDEELFTQAIGLCALESSNLLPPGEESTDDQKV